MASSQKGLIHTALAENQQPWYPSLALSMPKPILSMTDLEDLQRPFLLWLCCFVEWSC